MCVCVTQKLKPGNDDVTMERHPRRPEGSTEGKKERKEREREKERRAKKKDTLHKRFASHQPSPY